MLKPRLIPAVCFSVLFAFVAPLAGAGEFKTVLFQDDFSGTKLKKEWGSWKSESIVKDGVLVGITPRDADHPSVNTIKLDPIADLEVSMRFKFAGSKSFSVMFRDLPYKGSHAGHICHVAVSATSLAIYDGKTGLFRNDIREKRKAGKKLDAATEALLKAKTFRAKLKLDPKKWHDLRIAIEGDTLTVFIDGEKAGSLKSEGIAHETKSNMNITTVNRAVHYDDFAIKAR